MYTPYRVKSPLKRTNPEKGLDVDPGWVEITWDEALDTIGQKLKAIREDNPRKFIYGSGFGSDYTLLVNSFPGAFGTDKGPLSRASSTGSMCSVHMPAQFAAGVSNQVADPEYTKYLITIGRSLGPSAAHAEPSTFDILTAIEGGMKVVAVDPRRGVECSKGGEWLPIRPGTAFAFALGMAHVILHELDTFDVKFVKDRSTGPYLIGEDGNYVRDAESQKPLIWDPEDNAAKTFDDPSIKDFALEGNFQVGESSATPAFALLKEHLKEYTPEWSEEITTISAATLRRITQEFVQAASIGSTVNIDGMTLPLRPACIVTGRGSTNHYDGHMAAFYVQVINILVGAMDVPGGSQGQEFGTRLKPDEDGVVKTYKGHNPTLVARFNYPAKDLAATEFFPLGFSQGFRVVDGILNPEKYHLEYGPEAACFFGLNLFTKGGDHDEISEAMRRIPFTFTISYELNEHAAFADIVLPECSYMERTLTRPITERKYWIESKYYLGSLVNTPVVEPMYESRMGDQILLDLAERIGCLHGEGGLNAAANRSMRDENKLDLNTTYTIEEICDRALKSLYGAENGLEAFQDVGFIAKTRESSEIYNYAHFPGRATRHPIYHTLWKQVGEGLLTNLENAGIKHPDWDEDMIRFYYRALPGWRPTPVYDAPPEFEFYSVVWKTPPFLFDISSTNSNPYLQEISMNDPFFGKVLINPQTAEKKGWKDGDEVYLENRYGVKIGPHPIKLSNIVHTEVAGVMSGLSRDVVGMNPIASNGIPVNKLLSSRGETLDVITAAIEISPRVKVYKA
jgi:anaerobic selenocysteine-containing dehydrogenase